VTPPSVQDCPVSFSDKTDSLQKQVTWSPPTFTDNVGVASVLSNRQPGFEMQTYTSITIRYTASDAAGNVAYCTFNITLEGMLLCNFNSDAYSPVSQSVSQSVRLSARLYFSFIVWDDQMPFPKSYETGYYA